MASLVRKDQSTVYELRNGERERPERRTRSFKLFSRPGERRVAGQIGPIHYRLDPFNERESFKEIDLELIPTPDKHWDYAINNNGYQIRIWNQRRIQGEDLLCVGRFKRAGKWLDIAPVRLFWENAAGDTQIISQTLDTDEPVIDNDAYNITWRDVFGAGIHFRYNARPDDFFKTVIIDDFWNLSAPMIDDAGLKLTVELRMFWHGRAKAANGFGQSENAEHKNPGKFQYKDELDRDVFWVREPKAWDSAEDRQVTGLEWRLERSAGKNSAFLSMPEQLLGGRNYPVYMDIVLAEEQVGASADDAWKSYQGTESPDFSSTTGFLSVEHTSVLRRAFVNGHRFTTVPITQGSTITSAALSVRADITTSGDVDSVFEGLDSDDATTNFSSEANWDSMYPSGVTIATVTYNDQANWVNGTFYSLANIPTIVEEIVQRPGWNEGSMIIYWGDFADNTPLGFRRRYDSWDAGASFAPKFNAVYIPPAGKIMLMQIV